MTEGLRRAAAHVFVEGLGDAARLEASSSPPASTAQPPLQPLQQWRPGQPRGALQQRQATRPLGLAGQKGTVQLREEDFHHLSRALRLRPGEEVSVSDGAGTWVTCCWNGTRELEPAGEPRFEPRPFPLLTVAVALTKGSNTELAVQKLSEVGVDQVVVFSSARCVARWPAGTATARLARLREVARQAAMQCRRTWLPVVDGPFSFEGLLSSLLAGAGPSGAEGAGAEPSGGKGIAGAEPAGTGIALAVPGGEPLSLATPTVLVGPEGGWTGQELAAVKTHVCLGPHILRSETAAVAAGVLLVALRSRAARDVGR